MTLVSVIIPTKNRSAFLRAAIESVLAVERLGFDIEIFVVDNGSTDDTISMLDRYPVHVVHVKGGRGAAAPRNVGAAASKGDFLTFLDDDDVWLPNNISAQLRLFEDNPTFGAAHAQVQIVGPDLQPWGPPSPPGPLLSGWIFDDLVGYWPQIGSVLVKRSVWDELGHFDTALCDAEDWDLLLRIARRYPIGRVEIPVILFRQRDDANEALGRARFKDTVRVFRRHMAEEPLARRVRFQPVIWRHRGWFTSQFLSCAQVHIRHDNHARALMSLVYAAVTSPLHTIRGSSIVWNVMSQVVRKILHGSRRFPANVL
jgi:glycosyltransferase involved in cell wall biosynthesis